MTTFVSVTVEDRSPARAEDALAAALDEMERLAALLTRFDGASPLAVLNAEGRLADPPPELRSVLARGLDLSRLSGGAFDPTVAPLVDLYQVHFAAHGGPPDASERRLVQPLVGAGHVRLDEGGCRLERTGMSLTLDGIAKGHIVDAMVATLAARGVRHALVNAGGDIRALGTRASGRPWQVGVQDPRHPDAMVDRLPLADAAVATSGDYARFFDLERRYHHTVVPATGDSPQAIASASVRAPTAIDADALATAVFVLGAEDGCRLIEALPGVAGLLLMRDGSRRTSARW